MSREEDIAKAGLLTETVKQVDLGAKERDPPVIKRSVKMTEKAFLAKVEALQKERKDKLKKAASLKETIVNLMGDKSFVKKRRKILFINTLNYVMKLWHITNLY